jgi:hypothetical protein
MLANATLSRRGRFGSSLSGSFSSPRLGTCATAAGAAAARRAESEATSPPAARPFAEPVSAPGLLFEQAVLDAKAAATRNGKARRRAIERVIDTSVDG